MKSLYLVLCLSVFLAFGGGSPALAQTSIGVVDIQKVLADSLAGQSIQKQVDERRKTFQAEFSKIEQELRESQKTLAEKQSALSKEDFAAQRQEFEQKRVETLGLVQKRKASLDGAFTKAIKKLEKEVMTIISAIATEKKYDLVLSKSNVFISNDSLDISSQVTEKLNASISAVQVEIEGAP
ncbi:MAG: membrane protein [Micavibrio sp.]|nr:MAG: membrane protein [Micavibrio sp.]